MKSYDARFYVVADRYEYPGSNRSMEVCQGYVFDCYETDRDIGHEREVLQRMQEAGS